MDHPIFQCQMLQPMLPLNLMDFHKCMAGEDQHIPGCHAVLHLNAHRVHWNFIECLAKKLI